MQYGTGTTFTLGRGVYTFVRQLVCSLFSLALPEATPGTEHDPSASPLRECQQEEGGTVSLSLFSVRQQCPSFALEKHQALELLLL